MWARQTAGLPDGGAAAYPQQGSGSYDEQSGGICDIDVLSFIKINIAHVQRGDTHPRHVHILHHVSSWILSASCLLRSFSYLHVQLFGFRCLLVSRLLAGIDPAIRPEAMWLWECHHVQRVYWHLNSMPWWCVHADDH
jgi:hypothetical protein